MTVLDQTLQNPPSAPNPQPPGGKRRRRWILFALIGIAVLVIAGWAWMRFVNPGDQATQSVTTATTTAANGRANAQTLPARAAARAQQPVAESPQQPAAQQSSAQQPSAQQPESMPAAAVVMTTTHETPGLVVIASTYGVTLADAPDGEGLQTLPIGALLTAMGRSEDSTWLYMRSADGTTGWGAANQVIVFGVEKLAVMPLSTAGTSPALPVDTSATAVVSATEMISPTDDSLMATATTTGTTTAGTTTATESAMAPRAVDSGSAVQATVTVNGSRLNIRSGPGTRYSIVGKANAGDAVTVLARNATSDWVQIALPGTEAGFGWVTATYLQVPITITELSVSDAVSAAPALAAAVAPVAATDTIPAVATTASAAQTVATGDTTPVVVALPTVAPQSMSQVVTSQIAAQQAQTVAATGLRGTIVFQSSPGGMIYAYDLAAGRLWQLTNGFDPAISTDGQTVAFVRTAGENGVYLINIDGSNERLIFSGRSTLAAPKWSPDGNYILFTRGDEYQECRDLGRGICLTDNELLNQNPNFPVDDFPLIKVYESNLARVDTQGGDYRDIANLESARAADWNEAGIVYQSTAGLQLTADEPNATTQVIAHDPLKPAYEDPDWQPNGGRIVYVGHQSNHYEIFAINSDGSGTTALTKPVTTLVDQLPSNVAPAWSPDGQHIVFLSNRSANYSAGAWQLWVMDADGSNQHPLPIEVPITYTFGNEQAVSWGS